MDAGIQVGIPWRPHPSREKAFAETVEWYESHGFEVVTGEAPKWQYRDFNLSAARNWLVQQMTSPVMILSDADTVPEIEPLWAAIVGAAEDGLVHLPYHLYRYGSPDRPDGGYVEGATSGIFVFTRPAYASTRGFDERFIGWGFEDAAWRLAHLTLNGPVVQHLGIAQAAPHDKAARNLLSTNRGRYHEYQKAYGHAGAMMALVEGLEQGLAAGGAVTTTHAQRTAEIQARMAARGNRTHSRPLGA